MSHKDKKTFKDWIEIILCIVISIPAIIAVVALALMIYLSKVPLIEVLLTLLLSIGITVFLVATLFGFCGALTCLKGDES